MRYILAIVAAGLVAGLVFYDMTFLFSRESIDLSFEKPLSIDTLVGVTSLVIALFSLFVAVKQMRDATKGGKKQEEVLNASRKALEEMVSKSEQQQASLESSRKALEEMTHIAREQQIMMQLNVMNSSRQLAIMDEQRSEQERIRKQMPKLDLELVFSSAPQPFLNKRNSEVDFYIKDYQYFPATESLNEAIFKKPVALSLSHFPVINNLNLLFDEQSIRINEHLLGPDLKPVEGVHYELETTGFRFVQVALRIFNNGEKEALDVRYHVSIDDPNINVNYSAGEALNLTLYRYTRSVAQLNPEFAVPESISSFMFTIHLAYEGGIERAIPVQVNFVK